MFEFNRRELAQLKECVIDRIDTLSYLTGGRRDAFLYDQLEAAQSVLAKLEAE